LRPGDKRAIREFYRAYYRLRAPDVIRSIREIASREIAYMDFDEVMHRHISLDPGEAAAWLARTAPRDLYHSSAYYLFPDKPMGEKVWVGGDLIFDIDLDHIPYYDAPRVWICEGCGEALRSQASACPRCGGRLGEVLLPDPRGIDVAKREVERLIGKLTGEVGIRVDEETAELYFSGGRGFHLHVFSEDVRELDQAMRMEIKDYLTLDGFDIAYLRSLDAGPARELRELLRREDCGIPDEDRAKLLKAMEAGDLRGLKALLKGKRQLRDALNKLVRERLGVQIDGVVTVDVSRLIRAPLSLHGKTGMLKAKVELGGIDSFDPFSDAIFDTGDEVTVYVTYMPEVCWGGREYPEAADCRVRVPMSLAVFLVGRGLARGIRRAV